MAGLIDGAVFRRFGDYSSMRAEVESAFDLTLTLQGDTPVVDRPQKSQDVVLPPNFSDREMPFARYGSGLMRVHYNVATFATAIAIDPTNPVLPKLNGDLLEQWDQNAGLQDGQCYCLGQIAAAVCTRGDAPELGRMFVDELSQYLPDDLYLPQTA